LQEGERLEMSFQDPQGASRAVPVQVSGDPYVAHDLELRIAWGPLPLLASARSQLLASARRTLAHLRIQEAFDLKGETIGGVYHYRHDIGLDAGPDLEQRTGLFSPPLYLRGNLTVVQDYLIQRWMALETGPFVDTSRPGLQLGRQGRYAHNADQSAHLVVLKQDNGSLLVRQVRAHHDGTLYESRVRYVVLGGVWMIRSVETRAQEPEGIQQIIQESHFARSAEALEREALAFFPVVPAAHDVVATAHDLES
jgi:hypothetical protein